MILITILSIHISLMIAGYFSAIALGVKKKFEAIGLSYLIGTGFVTISFLMYHWLLGLDLNAGNFLLSVFTVSAVALLALIFKKRMPELSQFELPKVVRVFKALSLFEKTLLVLLIGIGLYTFLENYIWPVTAWDALALYDFRAKVIAATGNMVDGIRLGYFFQYPPYTSFLHLFGYIFENERVQVAYTCLYSSFLVSFYLLLRRNQAVWIALLGTLFLAVDNFIFQQATVAYTNLAYVAFLTLGLLYLVFWFQQGLKKDLLVGALLTGLSTWIRPAEPFWMLAIALIVVKFALNRKQLWESLTMIAIMYAISRFWGLFVSHLYALHDFHPPVRRSFFEIVLTTGLSLETIFSRIQEVGVYFYHYSFSVFSYVLLPFGFAAYYDWREKNKINIFLHIVLVVCLSILLAGIYVLSLYYDTWNQIPDSLQRVSMIFPPLLIFCIFNSKIWKHHAIGHK